MADVALGELRRQIRDNPAWAARQVSQIDRRHPGSPRGFEFGTAHTALSSAKRGECPVCRVSQDRDENAPKNIRAEGVRPLAVTCSVPGAGKSLTRRRSVPRR